jgi:hypothetical protein
MSPGSYTITVQAVNHPNNTVYKKDQFLDITVVDPSTITGCTGTCTGAVNIWAPTGCDTSSGCSWQETVSNIYFVDAKLYSNTANIGRIEVWVDGVKQNQATMTPAATVVYHSPELSAAVNGQHKLVVQGVIANTNNIVAKTTSYFVTTNAPPSPFSNIDDTSASLWGTCTGGACIGDTRPQNVTGCNGGTNCMMFTSDTAQAYDQAYWYYDWKNSWNPLPGNNAAFKYPCVARVREQHERLVDAVK